MIKLHPEFLTKNGKKEFAVLPYLRGSDARERLCHFLFFPMVNLDENLIIIGFDEQLLTGTLSFLSSTFYTILDELTLGRVG
ncbi:MAG: hypothetical protein WBM62_07870 [Crocosphaera sp.]